jgi:hypothetical protein
MGFLKDLFCGTERIEPPKITTAPINFHSYGLGAIYTPNQEETIKQFSQAKFIIGNAELMYLKGIEEGTELTIDIAIKQLERVKQLIKIQTPTNEDVINAMKSQVEDILNKGDFKN